MHEEWIEFTDSFGRNRKCLKKDLPQIKRLDKEVTLSKLEISNLKRIENLRPRKKDRLLQNDRYNKRRYQSDRYSPLSLADWIT